MPRRNGRRNGCYEQKKQAEYVRKKTVKTTERKTVIIHSPNSNSITYLVYIIEYRLKKTDFI